MGYVVVKEDKEGGVHIASGITNQNGEFLPATARFLSLCTYDSYGIQPTSMRVQVTTDGDITGISWSYNGTIVGI